LAKAEIARQKRRLDPHKMKALIRELCTGRFLAPQQLGQLVDRNAKALQKRFLRPMAKDGELVLRYPGEPNHPEQACRTMATDD
jgi:ATP-dependent DNA helicase RecG